MNYKDYQEKTVLFISWDRIGELCSKGLTELLHQPTKAYATSDEPDQLTWFLWLTDKSELNKCQTEGLLKEIGADDYEWSANDFGEYPVKQLTSGVAHKVLNRVLHREIEASLPDDEGVWFFINNPQKAQYHFLIQYPEADCPPNILRVLSPQNRQEVVRLAEEAQREVALLARVGGEIDRMSRLDLFVDTFSAKVHEKVDVLPVDWMDDI